MVHALWFVAGALSGGLFVRYVYKTYWHQAGFVQGVMAEVRINREQEHKFRQALWQDKPEIAARRIIFTINSRYQPTPPIWSALGMILKPKSSRRRILDVTSPGSPKSKRPAR